MSSRPYVVQNGCNNPIQAPLFQDPFVPYTCINERSVSVWAEVDPELIKKYLAPTPFEYVSNVFNISVTDFANTAIADASNTIGFKGFFDVSFCVPVKYKDLYGSYTFFEYENDDFCIAAGREMWAYPKVYADIDVTESLEKVVGTAKKRGVEIVRLEVSRRYGQDLVPPQAIMSPNINLQVIPRGEAPGGVLIKRVLRRDTSPDYRGRISFTGEAAMTLRFDGTNPLDEFSSAKIICGTYSCGEFAATGEYNGWGHVVDNLVWPEEF